MSELSKLLNGLGFPKTAKQMILIEDDDEDNVIRALSVVTGLLHIMQTHVITSYERTALLNESERVAKLFDEAHAKTDNTEEIGPAAKAISAAFREMVRTIKDRNQKLVAHIDEHSINSQVAMVSLAKMAYAIAGPLVLSTMSNEDLIEARRTNEPPQRLVETLTKAMKTCYFAPPNAAVIDTFRMYARAQARSAIEFVFNKRGLSLKEPHAD